jgi:hypothetical protein
LYFHAQDRRGKKQRVSVFGTLKEEMIGSFGDIKITIRAYWVIGYVISLEMGG